MKPLHWVGPSLRDLRKLPASAQDKVGHALYLAQMGGKHADAKPLKGFQGTGVPEVFEYRDDDAIRAVYTLKLASGVYVLHVYQKNVSQKNTASGPDIDLIRRRLADAIADAMGDRR